MLPRSPRKKIQDELKKLEKLPKTKENTIKIAALKAELDMKGVNFERNYRR